MPQSRSIGEILRDAEAGRLENIFAEEREPYELIGAAERLFDLLDERGIDYVLVGGIAMLQYVEGRNTRDVDLIVDPKELGSVAEIVIDNRDKDFARARFEGIQVDLLFSANKLFKAVRERHSRDALFGGRSLKCATPQGMLLLKLFALPSLYRQGDTSRAAIYEADIAGLLAGSEADGERALSDLGPHLLTTDIEELRKILDQIGQRRSAFLRQSKIQNPKSEID
ncbi:MAG: hypothetical protein AB7N24_13130 [Dehalococcoidia bacterium]